MKSANPVQIDFTSSELMLIAGIDKSFLGSLVRDQTRGGEPYKKRILETFQSNRGRGSQSLYLYREAIIARVCAECIALHPNRAVLLAFAQWARKYDQLKLKTIPNPFSIFYAPDFRKPETVNSAERIELEIAVSKINEEEIVHLTTLTNPGLKISSKDFEISNKETKQYLQITGNKEPGWRKTPFYYRRVGVDVEEIRLDPYRPDVAYHSFNPAVSIKIDLRRTVFNVLKACKENEIFED